MEDQDPADLGEDDPAVRAWRSLGQGPLKEKA